MNLSDFTSYFLSDNPLCEVKTSGSTGTPKKMLVEKTRMRASAKMTCDFLDLHEGDNALLCMSLDYIAGKMMVVRSIVRGLNLIEIEPCGHPFAELAKSNTPLDFAAIVPLQLYNTLQVPEEREYLKSIRHVIVGGGAVSEEVEKQLHDFPNAIWSTYGMTETLSHIAMRRLSGKDVSEWYTIMPDIILSQDKDGCLVIDAPTLCPDILYTNDIVELNENGTFRILGRRDNVICSGGIKLQIEEIERALTPYLTHPFQISKAKDEKFGEIVVLITEGPVTKANREIPSLENKYFRPRVVLHTNQLPLTETGKPARAKAQRLVAQLLNQ